MSTIKSALVVASIVGTAAALSACRKEVPHSPMKLGADIPAVEKVAR